MGNNLEWLKRIAEAQADNSGFIGLSRLLMERIGKSVLLTNNQGRVTSWQVAPKCSLMQEEKIYIPSVVLKAEDWAKGVLTLSGQKQNYYCWTIKHKGVLGYLWVLVGSEGLSPTEIEAIECIRLAILVEIVKRQDQKEIQQRLRDEIVHNIVFNNSDNVNELGQVWGWNLNQDYVVMVVEGKMKVYGLDIKELRSKAEELLNLKYSGVITGMIGHSFVVLFPLKNLGQDKNRLGMNWKGIPHEAFTHLQEELKDIEFWAGVGNVHLNSSTLYISYQEAKVALQLGRFSGKESRLAFFNELGALRLFYNQREQDLKDYFMEVLGPVKKYDEENEGNLLMTLWTYYFAGGNITAATIKLHIHVNTLRYRLHKVEELLGVKLDDQDVRFNIYAALKVGIMIGIYQKDGD